MANFTYLLKEQRDTIQYMIDNKRNFTFIGNAINKDRTTISKEIKRNRYVKSYLFEAFDPKGINKAENDCIYLKVPPYVCNTCSCKNKCRNHKLYYKSNIAHKHFEEVKKNSREGFDIDSETINEIEKIIIPLMKKQKQSINQVYINHADILYFSKPTFYKYIHYKVLSLSDIDLPRKVKYKPRKKNKDNKRKRKLALLIGRKYSDYLNFVEKHPNYNIVEMDTVVGKRDEGKVLLTLILTKTKFMFIRLLDKNNMESVDEAINEIKNKIGTRYYSKVFKIILTDNGSEFYNPYNFERDYNTGRKISNLFYCDPYCSWQKPCIEKNHHHIREVLPKGVSFEELTKEKTKKLEDNINNIPRDSLDGKTPYELTKKLYPKLIRELECNYISPDEVNRSYKHIKD